MIRTSPPTAALLAGLALPLLAASPASAQTMTNGIMNAQMMNGMAEANALQVQAARESG